MKKKLLICYHSSEYGGIEIQILDIIKGLSEEIDIIVASRFGTLSNEYINAGALKFVELYPKKEIDIGYIVAIHKLIKSEKVDIVHGHELLTGVQVSIAAKFAGCKKIVYHVHTPFYFWIHKGLKKYISLITNWIANYITANFAATDVIALTPSISKIREDFEKVKLSKIRIIPNAVSIKNMSDINELEKSEVYLKYSISKNDYLIGYIARFTAEKGHDVLINAFSQYLKINKKSKLILLSDGELGNSLKQICKSLKIENSVIFTGRVDDTTKWILIERMNLYVSPTLAEGFGISLIEAMAVGVPIISSDLPVLRDVGKDLVEYFPVGNVKNLVEKIELVSTIDKRKKDIITGELIKRSRDYSYTVFWDNYRKLYLN